MPRQDSPARKKPAATRRSSRLALASLATGLAVVFLLLALWLFMPLYLLLAHSPPWLFLVVCLAGIVFGVLALVVTERSRGKLGGRGLAVCGLVASLFGLV